METGGGGASGGSYKWNRKGIIARMAGLPDRRAARQQPGVGSNNCILIVISAGWVGFPYILAARQQRGAVVREHLHFH